MHERDEELVRREEEAAGTEAGSIGGRGDDRDDPAQSPLTEAGGGEAEGFEIAEAQLVDRAENPRGPSPFADRERISEDDRAETEYGESDSVRTSEDDPESTDSNW
jgi:hypothetical protein